MTVRKKTPYPNELKRKLKQLRINATPAEKRLWGVLKGLNKVSDFNFRRQHPIGVYIADFYCHKFQCVIEVDGSSHDTRIERDMRRDKYMQEMGLRILRFTDSDAQKNPEMIAETIIAFFQSIPSPLPLPEGGE